MKIRNLQAVAVVLSGLAVIFFQNCSGVNFAKPDSAVSASSVPPVAQQSPVCHQDVFTQPDKQITNKVDMLLVMHATTSFETTAYSAVSSGLQGAIQLLPPNADYRLSTISALDSVNDPTLSGKVFGTVFNSSNISAAAISNQLQHPQYGKSHGETGMSALIAALTAQKQYNQSAGALRPGAALAVFFLANEADLCGLPSTDPGTDDDWSEEYNSEAKVACPGVDPKTAFNTVQQYAHNNGGGYIMGGVIYTDKTIQSTASAEREFGWGYYQLIHDLVAGPLIDLASGAQNIASAIAAAGSQAGALFNVVTDFPLSQSKVDPATIVVKVAGAALPVPSGEVSFQNGVVHVSNPSDAGSPGAKVQVSYCEPMQKVAF